MNYIFNLFKYITIQLQTRFVIFRPQNIQINGKLRVSFDSEFEIDPSSVFILQGDLFIKKSSIKIQNSKATFMGGNLEGAEIRFLKSDVTLSKKCHIYYSKLNCENSIIKAGESFRARDYVIMLVKNSILEVGDFNLFNKNTNKDGFMSLSNSTYMANYNNKVEACVSCVDSKFIIGSNVFLNGGSEIRCNESVSIGSNVFVSYDTVIIDNNSHSVEPADRLQEILNGFPNGTLQTKELMPKSQPIQIGNNVWIGMRSGILKGSQIGNNAIVAFNTTVNGIVPDNTLAYGNPFKTKIMDLKKIPNS